MLRCTSMLLAACLASPALAAEPPPPEALETWAQVVELSSLQAQFVQTRTSKLLKQPLRAEGILRFRKPDQIAWIVATPAKSVLTMSGTRMGMAFPDMGIVQEIDLASDPDAARLVQGLMVWLGGDLQAVEESYDVGWSKTDQAWMVRLTPKPGPLAEIIGTLDLTVSGEPAAVSHVLITEPDGDTVTIEFSGVQRDVPLSDAQLALPGAR